MVDDVAHGEEQLDPPSDASERPPFVDLIVGPDREPDNRRFGGLLERLRWRAGLSRAAAAAQLGFSAEYLRLIEIGKRTPALGQMRKFLSTYGAEGAVETVMPGGDRPDLLIWDPPNDEPVIVEFKSRIREARRRALGLPANDEDWQVQGDHPTGGDARPSASRAADLGMVVSLLARADDNKIRKIRKILEGDAGDPRR